MKLFYVANVRFPTERAHGIQLAKMAEAFLLSGVDLTLVVPTPSKKDIEHAKEYYGLERDIPVVYLPVIRFGRSRLGFNLTALCFSIVSFMYLLLKRLKGITALLYTIDLDQFSYFLLPLVGWPVYIEVHGSKKQTLFTTYFFKRVRGVIAVSPHVRESLIDNFQVRPEKIIVEPNGVDEKLFLQSADATVARKKLGIATTLPVCLYVGRFYSWKGIPTLVEASRSIPEAEFYLVGGTEKELKSLIEDDEVSANVKCAGGKPPHEIPLWLQAADVLIVTGTRQDPYSFNETSPMKLFEYFASRRPVIAPRTKALTDIVSPIEVLFYEPDSVSDFAEKVRYTLQHHDERALRVEAAFKWVQAHTWKKRAERIVAFFSS